MTDDQYVFQFGKRALGKSVEQVALTDYPYLDWVERNVDFLSPQFYERIKQVRRKLNNFVHDRKCNRCSSPAGLFSIANNVNVGYHVPGAYTFCKSPECRPLNDSFATRFELYPIEYDTILELPPFPKYIRQDMHKLLLKVTNFKGKLTKENAKRHIDSLQTLDEVVGHLEVNPVTAEKAQETLF